MGNQIFEQIEEFYPLNNEAKQALEAYVELLLKWNKKINLIGKATEADIWNRHILDAAQLLKTIPKNTNIVTDFGAGAGIPAVILAILADEKHIKQVHAIESTTKKATFMKEAARVTEVNLQVHNQRIELLEPWVSDVVTARAFAPLNELFTYVNPFTKKEGLCVLLKGCKVANEIEEAQKNWQFSYDLQPSMVKQNDAGYVLKIEGLASKNG